MNLMWSMLPSEVLLVSGMVATGLLGIAWAVRRTLSRQQAELALLRAANARRARLTTLTTLAAGTAHELGTPLCTIAVVAKEAVRTAQRTPGAELLVEDLRLIRLEVTRCQEMLQRMAARARGSSEASLSVSARHIAELTLKRLGPRLERRVELRFDTRDADVHAPAEELAQSIAALIKNAIDASGPHGRVLVELGRDETGGVRVSVEDNGTGIPAPVLARLGDLAFTTKPPGEGLGLGLFLAQSFAESAGGALSFESRPGAGTRAVLRLPMASS